VGKGAVYMRSLAKQEAQRRAHNEQIEQEGEDGGGTVLRFARG